MGSTTSIEEKRGTGYWETHMILLNLHNVGHSFASRARGDDGLLDLHLLPHLFGGRQDGCADGRRRLQPGRHQQLPGATHAHTEAEWRPSLTLV